VGHRGAADRVRLCRSSDCQDGECVNLCDKSQLKQSVVASSFMDGIRSDGPHRAVAQIDLAEILRQARH